MDFETFHYTYRVDHPSGKFYVGRHSTNRIVDGYVGSGKWPRSIPDKSCLKKTILNFYDSEKELRIAEEKLIEENIYDPLNMNFNLGSCGWGCGDTNPSSSARGRARISKMDTELWKDQSYRDKHKKRDFSYESRQHLHDICTRELQDGTHNFLNPATRAKVISSAKARLQVHNPMWDRDQKERARSVAQAQLRDGTHNFLNPIIRAKSIEINRHRCLTDNPMKNPEIAAKLRKPRPKSECPYCHRMIANNMAHRYHFEKCKLKPEIE